MKKTIFGGVKLLLLTAVLSVHGLSQTDSKNLPQPPVAELKKLAHLFGKYRFTADYAELKWKGTLEYKPAVKGWYVERIIHLKTPGIDREFRSMITFDPALKQYRIWRFETLPPTAKNEGTGRFEGEVFVEEYELDDQEILRNKVTRTGKNEVRIVTEIQDKQGKIFQLGLSIGKQPK